MCAALVIAFATVVGLASVTDETAIAAESADRASEPLEVRHGKLWIDRSSRSAVARSYQDVLAPALATPAAFTGSVEQCIAGSETAASRAASLTAVNWFRALAGLQAVTFDPELDRLAQDAALMMAANNQLSHNPPGSWRCWTSSGAQGARRANLHRRAGAAAIKGYMDDPGAFNTAAGHRRWLLSPTATEFGHGTTTTSNALIVTGVRRDAGRPDPTWVSWPTAGYFPWQLEPAGRWSLSASTSAGAVNFSASTVVATIGGNRVPVVVNPPQRGFGNDTLVFEVDLRGAAAFASRADATVDVVVSNIVVAGRTIDHRYSVRLFDATVPVADAGTDADDSTSVSAVTPNRLVDTRANGATVDGLGARAGALVPGQVLPAQLAGRGAVPADAHAVVANVTIVGPAHSGYLVAWPCGSPKPSSSVLNFASGTTTANTILAKVGSTSGGVPAVCFESSAPAHLIVDVTGHVAPGGSVQAVAPARLLDTRPSGSTVDGSSAGGGRVAARSVTRFRVAGRGAVPTSATAAFVNVVAVNPGARGHVTVWPCDRTQPTASNLNVVAGTNVANGVLAKLSSAGEVCVFSSATTDLIVDLAAYVRAPNVGTGDITPIVPARLFESRPGQQTIDGRLAGTGRLPAGSVTRIGVAGRGGVPASAAAVVVNLTAVRPSARGFVTVWPCDGPRPSASALNVGAAHLASGSAVANSGLARLSSNGDLCLYASVETDIVVDVTGYAAG